MAETTLGPLNLSDADTSGFEAVDPQRLNAEVFQITQDAVKNTSGQGKMPAGTPMIKVQWRATEDNVEGLENRRFFSSFVIPPKDYDKGKAQKMKGMLVNFLTAIGEDEEAVRGKGYSPDWEDFLGRAAVITVGKQPKKDAAGNVVEGEYNNPVTGIKPAGSDVGQATGSLL